MKIFKMSDRMSLSINGVLFKLSPLSFAQKGEIHACSQMSGGVEEQDTIKMTFLAVKYTVKEIKGIVDCHDNEYELEFEGDVLSDACVNDLLNLEICAQIGISALNFLNGIPSKSAISSKKKLRG